MPAQAGIQVSPGGVHHTLFAQSPNFPSQSYALNTGKQVDTLALFNVSVGLAPAPAAPARPAIIRK